MRAGAEQEGASSGNGSNLKDAQAYPPARSTGGHYCSTTMVSRAGRRAPARFLLLLVWLDDNGECEQEGASSGNDTNLKDAQTYPPAQSTGGGHLLTAPDGTSTSGGDVAKAMAAAEQIGSGGTERIGAGGG